MRVMTWNVENLFRPGGLAGVTDPALYEQKLENLAGVITAQRPDVVGLQEIGDPGALDELKAKLGPRYPHVLVASHFDPRHPIRVAALLRRGLRPVARDELIGFPPGALTGVPQAAGPLSAMGRGALAFSAAAGAERVRFIVTHLKSKLLTYPGGRFQPRDEDERARAGGFALLRRAAEAVAVRVWANAWLQAHAGALLVLVGDLNDGPDAATNPLRAARPQPRAAGQGRSLAARQPLALPPGRADVQPDLPRARRADRPHPRQHRPRPPPGRGDDRRDTRRLDRRPALPAQEGGLAGPRTRRRLHHLIRRVPAAARPASTGSGHRDRALPLRLLRARVRLARAIRRRTIASVPG